VCVGCDLCGQQQPRLACEETEAFDFSVPATKKKTENKMRPTAEHHQTGGSTRQM